jgi:hypothetical protein
MHRKVRTNVDKKKRKCWEKKSRRKGEGNITSGIEQGKGLLKGVQSQHRHLEEE